MKCEWKELLSILPLQLRNDVDALGKETLQELRIRLGKPVELIRHNGQAHLQHIVKTEDISYIVNAASRYSPWSAATAKNGYITAPGGHRIGLCGECVMNDGTMTGMRNISSLCIRVARDFPGIAGKIRTTGSCLILGPPGWGKTTLLRDLIRQISEGGQGSVTVVDERGELYPPGGCFAIGTRTDVLTGCNKKHGVLLALRTMGPTWLAVDEITAPEDCDALLQACWCGVKILATAHASCKEDLVRRKIYQPIVNSGIFETLIILQQDKSWRMERMEA